MSNHRVPRLAFDMDGVFADFVGAFLRLVNAKYGTTRTADQWVDYGVPVHPSLFTDEEFSWGMEAVRHEPYFWATLAPLVEEKDRVKLNQYMEEMLCNGYFITRRSDLSTLAEINDAQVLSRMWLENHQLGQYSAVICTKADRSQAVALCEADAYLDDWGEQFVLCRQAGINAYLIDRPYNRHIAAGERRVYSVMEFVHRALMPASPMLTYASGRQRAAAE